MIRHASLLVPTLVLTLATGLAAQDAPDEAGDVKPPAFPEDLLDPPFDLHVDLAFARRALRSTDPALVADAALQTAAGEQRLGRPRRGVDADQLLTVAIRLAADQGDKATLDRLARATDSLGKKNFSLRIAAARKLADQPRAPSRSPRVPVSRISAEAVLVFRAMAQEVKLCASIGDRKGLQQLKVTVGQLDELHPRQREYLVKGIDKALAAAGQAGASEALAKLAGVGRGTSLYFIRNVSGESQQVNIAGLGIFELGPNESKSIFSAIEPRVVFLRTKGAGTTRWRAFPLPAGRYRITSDPNTGQATLSK